MTELEKRARECLESLAREPEFICGTPETCGLCCTLRIHTDIARELLAMEHYDLETWGNEVERRWKDSKFYRLYQEELSAGRDPEAAFAARGWSP